MGEVLGSIINSVSRGRLSREGNGTEAGPAGVSRFPTSPRFRSVGQFVAAFAVLTVVLVLVRGDLLWTSALQNPDEAELLAEGRGAAADLFPYREYTTSTHLFLWPFVLGVLGKIGVPLTLGTAHVIGGLCYVMVASTGWFLLMRRLGGPRAALLVLPTTLFLFLGFGSADFLSMSSESLPLVLICAAALILLGPDRVTTHWQVVAGSVTAGLSIWAKPQGGPVAAAVVASCVVVAVLERRRTGRDATDADGLRHGAATLGLAVVGFLAPTIVFCGVLLAGGTWDEFAREPLASMWNYSANRDVSQGIASPGVSDRLSGVAAFAIGYPFAWAWTFGGLVSLGALAAQKTSLSRGLGVLAFGMPLVGALATLLPIYPLFAHYANFLYLGCLMATCVAVRIATVDSTEWTGYLAPGAFFGVTGALVGLLLLSAVPHNVGHLAAHARGAVTGDEVSSDHEVDLDASSLARSCPASSRVVVWGWAPELYAYYDWTPASRYVNATWLLNRGNRRGDYHAVFLRELKDDPPDCIVEALGPTFFADIDPTSTMSATVRGSEGWLDSCYTSTSSTTFDDRPVGLHLRRERCA